MPAGGHVVTRFLLGAGGLELRKNNSSQLPNIEYTVFLLFFTQCDKYFVFEQINHVSTD